MRTTPLIQEVLGLVRFVRQVPEGAPLDANHLRTLFRGALGRMHRNGQQLGIDSRELDEMGYALVALIDETIVSRGGNVAYEWMREQLQLAIYGENTAGENFFHRLDFLRRDANRADLLAVYYVVLCLGFRGMYSVHGELQWQELVESVRVDLERYGVLREADLSPNAARPRDNISQRSDGRAVLWIGIFAAVLGVLFYSGLWIDLAFRVDQALATISASAANIQPENPTQRSAAAADTPRTGTAAAAGEPSEPPAGATSAPPRDEH